MQTRYAQRLYKKSNKVPWLTAVEVADSSESYSLNWTSRQNSTLLLSSLGHLVLSLCQMALLLVEWQEQLVQPLQPALLVYWEELVDLLPTVS